MEQKKYSIAAVKAEIISEGINFSKLVFSNEELQGYRTKNMNTSPLVIEKKMFDSANNVTLIPSELIVNMNSKKFVVKVRSDVSSKIYLMLGAKKEYYLDFSKDRSFLPEKVKVELVSEDLISKHSIEVNGKTKKVEDYVKILGLDRVGILLFDGCWSWNMSHACLFCDLHPKVLGQEISIPSVNNLPNYKMDVVTWWENNKDQYIEGLIKSLEYIKKSGGLKPHFHIMIMSGNLPSSKDTWYILQDLVRNIGPYLSKDTIVNVQPHDDIEKLRYLKENGVSQVSYNLEVYGDEIYKKICIGKPYYKTTLKKLEEATTVLGRGKVRTNFVLGLQPISDTKVGVINLAEKGIVSDFTVFQPKKGTPLADRKSPELEDILEFSRFLVNIYQKYGFQPIYCMLGSRSSVVNEMFYDATHND